MNSPARGYDPQDRPRFNEWVRLDAEPAPAVNGRRSEHGAAAAANKQGRTSGLARTLPALVLFLVAGLAGGFYGGRSLGYQGGYTAGLRSGKADADTANAASAHDLERKVKAVIAANPMLNDVEQNRIDVKVIDELSYLPGTVVSRGRVVKLTGHVVSREAREAAKAEAVSAAGPGVRVVSSLVLK